MRAIVVYESHWGNTTAIARAVAEGIGLGAQVMSTADATADIVAGADLIVAGAPLLAFSLPTEAMLKNRASGAAREATSPDPSHPGMRMWLDALPPGQGSAAAFETCIWWSPGSASKAILKQLEAHGYKSDTIPINRGDQNGAAFL